MFTRIHYKAIAEIIKNNLPLDRKQNEYCKGKTDALGYTAIELAEYFEADNPRFDRNKFMAACGMD